MGSLLRQSRSEAFLECICSVLAADNPAEYFEQLVDRLTSSTDLKDGDSQVQPFMPERESSENSLTSRHLSDKPDGMKLRSDSVANGDIVSELDTKSRTSLHPPT